MPFVRETVTFMNIPFEMDPKQAEDVLVHDPA